MSFKDLIDVTQLSHGSAANGLSLGLGKGGLSLSANFNKRLEQKVTESKKNSALQELFEEYYYADIVFPPDIDAEHFIRFNQIHRVQRKEYSNSEVETKRSIVLPLPSNLNPQYSASYKDQEMGIAGALASGVVSTNSLQMALENAEVQFGDAFDEFTNFVEGSASAGTKSDYKQLGAALTTVGGAALLGKLAGGNLGALIGAAAGGAGTAAQGLMSRFNRTLNSHMAVLFDGVGFRTFNFTYRFVPRSPGESKALREMIHTFKKAMYPSLPADNKFLFTYPDEFMIEYSPAIQPYMHKFKRCVLKDMQVTYNGDGVPRFFDDGAPAVIDMTMSFQEVEIVTKEDMISPEDSM